MPLTIIIGSDHAGRELRAQLHEYLQKHGNIVVDSFSVDDAVSTDYPDIAHAVATTVISDSNAIGILICGTGIGMSISANRHRGIRAALCTTELHAKLARQHNHANILCLGARMTGIELAIAITDAFVTTPLSHEERHERRVEKIEYNRSRE